MHMGLSVYRGRDCYRATASTDCPDTDTFLSNSYNTEREAILAGLYAMRVKIGAIITDIETGVILKKEDEKSDIQKAAEKGFNG